MTRKTKIICTMGPACSDIKVMEALLKAGMNIARFNFSHGTHEEQGKRIEILREASENTNIPVALLLDTKGPQIRTGVMKEPITLQEGQIFHLTPEKCEGDHTRVSFNYPQLLKEIKSGDHILIADGIIDLEVQKVEHNAIRCIVCFGGILGSQKNINVPNTKISISPVTNQDILDIQFGIRMQMDFIAASFVRTADDVHKIQEILDAENNPIKIIAKIETRESLDNIHSITLASSGVMVARGDLGVQLDAAEVPLSQKRIIQVCNQYGRAVITATQMLESMIFSPRPTRAEATDIANAIFDGTDAIMLSGETATGKYPVTSVHTMHRIATTVEQSREYQEIAKRHFHIHADVGNVSSAVAKSAYLLARDTHSSAILAPSLRGNSPKMLSMFRPNQPIIAITTKAHIFRSLLMYWGVYPLLISQSYKNFDSLVEHSIRLACEKNIVQKYDFITITAGLPLGSPTMLNTNQTHFIGEILLRGSQGYGERVHGKVVMFTTSQDVRNKIKGEKNIILVCTTLDPDDYSLLRHVKGLIVEKPLRDLDLIIYSSPHLAIVAGIHSVESALCEGQCAGILGKECIAYEIEENDIS